ncbi:MAG: Hsp20/alpha crystallin family protein [Desulfococcaceae bacterium]
MFQLIPWKKKQENTVAQSGKEPGSLFERFFDNDFFPMSENLSESGFHPKVDVTEGKKDITVKAEIPGADAKDIDVSVSGRLLTIKGEKKQEKEEKDKNCHRIERSYGYFSRTVELPADVDETDADASYKKGVLQIVLKKTKESETRKIEVKAA